VSLTAAAFVILGVAILVAGAEGLVRGAAALAARTGISSVVIGLTVVAFGTSTPELAVSLAASLGDNADIALGNVVGSNIVNVLLILGASAVVGGSLIVNQRIVRIDVPIMIGASLLLLVFALDNRISRIEGAILFLGILVYTTWTVRAARREPEAIESEYDESLDPEVLRQRPLALDVLFVLGGLGLLVLGADFLVDGATTIAKDLGASDLVIGLTVVAVGTSMPELATSVVAAVRGERDIAVGNVVGSNIFNILCVLGLASAASSAGVHVLDSALRFDIPVMTAVAVACLPVFFHGHRVARWEGALFVLYYVAYVTYLVLDATDAAAFDPFRDAMAWFVLPLTVVTIAVIGVQAVRTRGGPAAAGRA
jgi:cation:H+ antiporter